MADACSEEMVRAHTATLSSHEEQIKSICAAHAKLVDDIHRLERVLMGNGAPSLGEQITRSIAEMSSALSERMVGVERDVRAAHKRLDRLQASQWWLVGLILVTALGVFIGGHL